MIVIRKRKNKVAVEQYVVQENPTPGTWGSHQLLLEELKGQDEDWIMEYAIRPSDPQYSHIPAGLRYSKKFIQLIFNTNFLEKMLKTHGELHCEYCGKPHLKIYHWNEKQRHDIATTDHFLPKIDWPDLQFNEDNLRVCCSKCNTKKGRGVWSHSAVRFPYPEHLRFHVLFSPKDELFSPKDESVTLSYEKEREN